MKMCHRVTLFALLIALASLSGCGGRSEPTPQPKPVEPVVENTSAEPSAETSPKTELPPVSVPPKVEPPPQTSRDNELRSLVEKLARKEAGKWKIDEEAQVRLEERGPQVVDQLLPLLADESTDVRRGAAYHLLQLAASRDDLAQAYTKLLEDPDATIRGIALGAVGQFKPVQKTAAAPQLAEMLADKIDDDQRATAARLLGDVGPEAASLLPQLSSAAANDSSPKVRSSALLAISRVAKPAESVEVFLKGLGDQDQAVRLMAVQRLRELGRDAAPATDKLAGLLDDKNERIRRTAGEALVRMGGQSLPALTAALDSDSRDAREIAVLALGKMGALAKPALSPLKKRLGDSDPKVKELAKVAILQIESQ